MITVAEAQAAIAGRMPCWPVERVEVDHAAGRVLAEDVEADRDQPPFDRVTMDGVALRAAAVEAGRTRFAVQGTHPAGAPAPRLESEAHCFEVMTGAVLPDGCDSVVPVEELERRDGEIVLAAAPQVVPGRFVHGRGTDYAAGSRLLQAGVRIGPPEIAVLSSVGHTPVAVAGLPRITVVSTGDELVAAGESAAPHQIRRANDYAIAGALRARGVRQIIRRHLRDDRPTMLQAVGEALAQSDVLILSGGVSRGRFDYLPEVLDELGVERAFHRVRQRPGKPMWFGTQGTDRAVFALPGNPVSALVCLYRYVLPALDHAAGAGPRLRHVVLGGELAFTGDLTRFVPVTLALDDGGRPVAVPRELNTSGDFFGLAGSDGFVELDGAQAHWHEGTVVPFHPW